MLSISNCPLTGFAREVTVTSLKDDMVNKTVCLCFSIKTKNGEIEIPQLNKNHMFPMNNKQLVDPVDGSLQTSQNETNDYIGEYTYIINSLSTKTTVELGEAKVLQLDASGML